MILCYRGYVGVLMIQGLDSDGSWLAKASQTENDVVRVGSNEHYHLAVVELVAELVAELFVEPAFQFLALDEKKS
jgi:hypothetical protein